ncbi:DUF4150 domain-containing protein [Candidatus Methylospira mobilis]|uniref:DUF4150 domain-containing protein n=2 Tax=Candidatus Methylospira mobilis TaxID=1808979 RepID=A0A5Q0BI59_9GAMM|nr:DUF4150 domain-containing protein [Candidatus Methylospira mobilis]
MFMHNISGGMNMAMPDVCKTPVGPAVVPIPYPNISTNSTANPSSTGNKVLLDFMPSVHQMTSILTSNGDQAGVLMGVASNLIMGPTEFVVGCNTVLVDGKPVQRLTSTTKQNGQSPNCVGTSIVPTQVKVLAM